MINLLPLDVQELVFYKLTDRECAISARVCKLWHKIIIDSINKEASFKIDSLVKYLGNKLPKPFVYSPSPTSQAVKAYYADNVYQIFFSLTDLDLQRMEKYPHCDDIIKAEADAQFWYVAHIHGDQTDCSKDFRLSLLYLLDCNNVRWAKELLARTKVEVFAANRILIELAKDYTHTDFNKALNASDVPTELWAKKSAYEAIVDKLLSSTMYHPLIRERAILFVNRKEAAAIEYLFNKVASNVRVSSNEPDWTKLLVEIGNRFEGTPSRDDSIVQLFKELIADKRFAEAESVASLLTDNWNRWQCILQARSGIRDLLGFATVGMVATVAAIVFRNFPCN